MDVKEGDFVQQVVFDSSAIIHIHEFTWNKPPGKAVICHPCTGETKKVTVKSGKAAKLHATCLGSAKLQASFIAVLQMVVSDVGWVANKKIEARHGLFIREICTFNNERRVSPESIGRLCIVRVYLKAEGFNKLVLRKNVPQRRIEGP